MTLNELFSIVTFSEEEQETKTNEGGQNEKAKKARVTRKALEDGDVPEVARAETRMGSIVVYADGTVLFEDLNSYTVFSLKECTGFNYTSADEDIGSTCEDVPLPGPYDPDFINEVDWYIGILFIGKNHIDKNRNKRNIYTPLEEATYEGTMDYGDLKISTRRKKPVKYGTTDFTEDCDRKVDIQRMTKDITTDQKQVIHEKYWEDKSFQKIGEERGGSEETARQRAKGIHDRAINSIRRVSGEELKNYRPIVKK